MPTNDKKVVTTSLALVLHFFSALFPEPPFRSSLELHLETQSLWDIKENWKHSLTNTPTHPTAPAASLLVSSHP